MFIATLSVQKVDRGWAVRVGPDVLVRYPTKGQALLSADWHATAIQQLGGRAVVLDEPPAAVEAAASQGLGEVAIQRVREEAQCRRAGEP